MKETSLITNIANMVLRSFWSAICLAFVESIVFAFLSELIYLVEIVLLKWNTGVEGGQIPLVLLQESFAIFGWRIIYGFVPVTAAALCICCFLRLHLEWFEAGILNTTIFILTAAFWEGRLHLLEHLMRIHRPHYQNFMHLLLLACFLSPLLLLKMRVWGSVLPSICQEHGTP